MRRLTYLHPRRLLLATSLAALTLAACGGDDGGGGDADAAPDSPPGGVCGVEATTISTYPATFSGSVITGGDELDVIEGACADERGWWGPYGPDEVVVLTGLTAGTTYVLDLDTSDDLAMYVTETCASGGPAAGSCLLLVDETTGAESGEFVAPASGTVYVIIDTADGVTLADGNYTLGVRAAECTDSSQCSAAAPICSANFECVQCTNPFHCTGSGAPVCDGATNTCVAGSTQCTGDDGAEPDDGPAAARTMTFPTANTPTTLTGSVCSLPAIEGDWYTFTATAAGQVRVGLTWNDANADMDVYVYNSTGGVVARAIAEGAGPEAVLATLPAAGEYFMEVYLYDPANSAPAIAYSVSLSLPECTNSFQCPNAGEPVCSVGECVVGPAQCTGDDGGEPNDDGPAGARPIATPTIGTAGTATGKICNTPSSEADWYTVTTVGAGEGLVANLSWTAGPDLDVYIYDNMNRLLGTSFWLNPEVVTLTYLPAGTYYLAVYRAGTATAPAYDYTLSVTRTAAQTCTAASDCAAEYKTQLYRGDCTGGTCNFIAAGTRADGMGCDSADDCMSMDCSYIAFEADAQDSVCTHSCSSAADCANIPNTACSTGFATNVCLPTCTTNLECGANVNSSMLDTGEPWNYFTCTPATGVCAP